MDKALFDRAKTILARHVPPDVTGREALIHDAWFGEQAIIDGIGGWNSSRNDFTTQLLMVSVRYGQLADRRYAVVALLETLTGRVGADEKDAINHLIFEIQRYYAPENLTKQHDIFLSYKREESDTMQRVKAALEAEGFTVWTDEHLVAGTPNWVQAVDEALHASRAWIGLYSPRAVKSRWIQNELKTAEMLEQPIFPVAI